MVPLVEGRVSVVRVKLFDEFRKVNEPNPDISNVAKLLLFVEIEVAVCPDDGRVKDVRLLDRAMLFVKVNMLKSNEVIPVLNV